MPCKRLNPSRSVTATIKLALYRPESCLPPSAHASYTAPGIDSMAEIIRFRPRQWPRPPPRPGQRRRFDASGVRERILNRIVWSVALAGIASGLYFFGETPSAPLQVTALAGPNVRSVDGAGSSGCNIKGNISVVTGERIYHVPGQKYYAATRISPSKGERWFCSEWRAWLAGWRKAKL